MGTSPATRATGSATFSLRWPQQTRLIPDASNSVRVTLKDPTETTVLAEKVMARPTGGGETTTTFVDLPIGPVTASAAAYPNPDGTGVAQATASVGVTVASGENAGLRLTLASTITELRVTPANPTLAVNAAAQLSGTAKNAAGEVVLTSTARLQWVSSDPSRLTIDAAGKATGKAGGTAVVTVTDTESGKSGQTTVTVEAPPVENLRQLSLAVNDLVYDKNTGKLYASVPGSAGANGNSVVSIDPVTLEIGAPIPVGGNPGPLAISDDGKYLYVGLTDLPEIRRVNLSAGAADQGINLGKEVSGFTPKDLFAEQIEVQPGNPDVIAVSRRRSGVNPHFYDVAVFDNGVMRVKTTYLYRNVNAIEFGAAPGRLYGYNNETSGFTFTRMIIDGSGVEVEDVFDSFDGNLLSGFNEDIEFENGRLYSTNGRVIDPEQRIVLGNFALGSFGASGPVRPDSGMNRVFFVTRTFPSNVLYVRAFDSATFAPLGELTIPGAFGTPGSLVRWGAKGLAFRTNLGKVYIITTAPSI